MVFFEEVGGSLSAGGGGGGSKPEGGGGGGERGPAWEESEGVERETGEMKSHVTCVEIDGFCLDYS